MIPARRPRLLPAAVLFVAALAAFAWVASALEATGRPLGSLDAWAASWLHPLARPWLTDAMLVISFIGAPSTLTAVAAVVCLILLRRRGYGKSIELITLVLGGNLLNVGLKHLIHRGRPELDPLVALTSYSFPSGHAMASTVFYGFALPCLLADPPRRAVTVAAGILLIALVGLSRVYLGVHYASDVIGGILEAVAWSTLMPTVWRLAGEHRRDTGSRTDPE